VGTFKALSEQAAKNPKDVPLLAKLAKKYSERDPANMEKANALYKQIVAIDPDGRMGTTEYGKNQVSCTELAEFSLGQSALYARGSQRSPEPLKAFVKKYPASNILKSAYMSLSSFYAYAPGPYKEEAFKFLEEAVAKYPDDPYFRLYYVSRSLNNKENIDRGIEMAEGMGGMDYASIASYRARLYQLKGDLSQAEAVYSSEFMDGRVTSLANSLSSYASFWMQQKKNLDSAEKMLQTAILLQPDNAYFRQSAAGFYLQAGKTDKALEVFGPEFIKIPKLNASALMTYARFWVQRKQNMDSATAAMESALKLSPEEAYVRQSAAQVFIMMEKQDKALEIYGAAFIKAQDNPLALSNYGRFWAGQKKNLDSALEAAKKATTLADQSFNQAYHWDTLAAVYLAAGKPEEALKAEEKALSFDEGFNTEFYQTQLKKIKDEIEKKTKK
jgi:tetratricopeptide (TPR) repeat protein